MGLSHIKKIAARKGGYDISNMKNYWEITHPAISSQTKTILNEYLLSLKLANKAEATIKK